MMSYKVITASMLFLCLSTAYSEPPKTVKMQEMDSSIGVPPNLVDSGAKIETLKDGCNKNASDNVAWTKEWKKRQCGLVFDMSTDHNYYFKKCMAGDPVALKDRQLKLAKCICKEYAAKAKKQNDERISKGCPPVPIASWWSSDYKYHYNWCVRGANPLKADGANAQREKVLKAGCKKQKETVTVQKSDVLMLFKISDPAATFADVPYSGSIKSVKGGKLKKITNNTPYILTFMSGHNPSMSAAKCSIIGTGIKVLYKLSPGASKGFPLEDISYGKNFYICTMSKNEVTLKLTYEYEVTTSK
jgi:hypothetical protein